MLVMENSAGAGVLKQDFPISGVHRIWIGSPCERPCRGTHEWNSLLRISDVDWTEDPLTCIGQSIG